MVNCAIYEKNADNISFFILDCVQYSRDFKGSNTTVTGVKESIFDTKWTIDIANPIYDEDKHLIGYDKKVSELSEALRYMGVVVSSRADVDTVTKSLIREKYDIDREFQINREKKEPYWQEYNDYVSGLVLNGRLFKEEHFPIDGI